MSLQAKVTAIFASIWILICLAIYIDSKLILEKKYQNLEQSIVLKDMTRVHKAFDGLLHSLELYTTSYAVWDEEYNFIKKPTQKFISENFVPGTYTSTKTNFYLLFDNNAKLVYGQNYDLNTHKFMPIPDSLLQQVTPLIFNPQINIRYSGLIKLTEGFAVISILPVLTSNGKGPPAGTILMGYYLTPVVFQQLSQTVDMPIEFIPLNKQPYMDSSTANATNHLLANDFGYIDIVSNKLAYGYTLLKDIFNEPIGVLKIKIPRDIYVEGLTTIYHYLVTFLIIGIIITITMWLLMKKLVLNRILDINDQIIQINTEARFDERVEVHGNDELKNMVTVLNSMLELIELTQEQLKYRISKRTHDLEKLSLLNRNLFSEMSKQRTIETKLREDEKILRKLAYYDTLTGLPNRVFFNELLLKAMEDAGEKNEKIAVIFIDADKFKKINDTYGHDFGNRFLKLIAHRLKEAIKHSDVVARIGGDEFILFCINMNDKNSIDDMVKKIFAHLNEPINIEGISVTTYFSIGISIYPDDGKTIETLSNEADLAMYYAKKRHGNVYYYYNMIDKTPGPISAL